MMWDVFFPGKSTFIRDFITVNPTFAKTDLPG